MTGRTFQSWLVVGTPDRVLENILHGLKRFADVDLYERPLISMDWDGQSVRLRATDPDALFLRLFQDRPRPVLALSLVPYPRLREFHNKTFQHEGSRYRISCGSNADFPYHRRFIEMRYVEAGIQADSEEVNTIVERVKVSEVPSDSLLWLDPQSVDLEEAEVSYLFDFAPGKPQLGANMTGAFFLPPVRNKQHPDLWPVIRAELEPGSEHGSYFSPELLAIRSRLTARALEGRAIEVAPTALTVSRLVDDPLLRDILLDTGAVLVNSEEGKPTTIALHIHSGNGPGSLYRAASILEPNIVEGPAWGRNVLRAIREDVSGLLPGGWEIGPSRGRPPSWRLQSLRPYRPGGFDGTWAGIRELRDALDLPRNLHDVLEYRILVPASARDADSPDDNDLAELMFMHDLWRCSWTDDLEEPAWRQAMIELLRDGFRSDFESPDARVESWNLNREDKPEFDRHDFLHSRRGCDGPLLVRYSGIPTHSSVLKWRLLLPLGSIINARTLYLDVTERSQLNNGFVLA